MDRQRMHKADLERASDERRSRSLRRFLSQWAKRHMQERVVFKRRRA
jgi:hypothetical protein